jgi:uncharacterized membrane protein YhhN
MTASFELGLPVHFAAHAGARRQRRLHLAAAGLVGIGGDIFAMVRGRDALVAGAAEVFAEVDYPIGLAFIQR